jgi:hypothetical protein
MDAQEIQALIDAGIQSGMDALKTADNLSSITLIFGIVVAFLIVLALTIAIVVVVIVLWGRSQKGTSERDRRADEAAAAAVSVATDLRIEAAAMRAQQSTVLAVQNGFVENETMRSKAMTALAQGVEAVAIAVGTISGTLENVGTGQTMIGTTTQSTDSKVNAILTLMRESGVKVEDILVGMGLIGINVQKLAEFAIRPTPAAQQDVKEIADTKVTPTAAPVMESVPVPA